MATKKKSDSFFLRIGLSMPTTTTYTQVEEDLGAYVDALGKSVLRVHNIQVAYQDDAFPGKGPAASTSGDDLNIGWQLTTQSQSDLVQMDDKSVVSSGRLFTAKDAANQIIVIDEFANVNPMDFTNGYLIATESIYLSAKNATATSATYKISLILECTVEQMDERAAMALALSQQ